MSGCWHSIITITITSAINLYAKHIISLHLNGKLITFCSPNAYSQGWRFAPRHTSENVRQAFPQGWRGGSLQNLARLSATPTSQFASHINIIYGVAGQWEQQHAPFPTPFYVVPPVGRTCHENVMLLKGQFRVTKSKLLFCNCTQSCRPPRCTAIKHIQICAPRVKAFGTL